MNEETIDVENVLSAVNRAFETGLIDCVNKDDNETRIEVSNLKRLVKRAVQQTVLEKMLHDKNSSIMRNIFE